MSHKRYQNPKKGYSRADRRRARVSITFEQDLWLEDEDVALVPTTVVEPPTEADVATLMATGPGEPVPVEQVATAAVRVDEPVEASTSEQARFRRVDRLLAAICRTG